MHLSVQWRKSEAKLELGMRNAKLKNSSNSTARDVQRRLKKLANPEHAAISQRFFKTGPGEYGEGDVFIGIRVPVLRKLAGEFKNLPVNEAEILLQSPIHEERLLAILLFVHIFKKGDDDIKKTIYHLYLKSTEFINNWDLVDTSAEHIVGAYLMDKNKRCIAWPNPGNCGKEESLSLIHI